MNKLKLDRLPPLSLYIHIPWCVKKCPYCDFNSHSSEKPLPEQAYINALLKDLDTCIEEVQNRELVSIFFGGGTPSLFSPEAINTLLLELRRRIPWQDDIEITLEANPGTVDEAHFRGYHQAGVNRLSLGIQSFNDRLLQSLGRIHDGPTAIRAIENARRAGFDRFNLDLMYGLPQQTTQQALEDLHQALALAPSHLSWYELTIEPNTAFYSRPPARPTEDTLDNMEQSAYELLEGAGLERYEISAYAQPGHQAQHNLNYWRFGDYLGIGAGAHSKLSNLDEQSIRRVWKTRMPDDYLSAGQSPTQGQRALGPESLPLEFMMNAMRLKNGVSAVLFEERTGLSGMLIEEQLKVLRKENLLIVDEKKLQTTPAGYKHLNTVLQPFMVD